MYLRVGGQSPRVLPDRGVLDLDIKQKHGGSLEVLSTLIESKGVFYI